MSLWSSVKFAQRYAQLPTVFYRLVTPQPLDNSRWVIWNGELAQGFALPKHADDPQLLAVFSGAEPFSAFKPLAMKYAGHQFGVYNPDLGDGRGLLLAEMQNRQGQWFDIHLKGAGLTPFSRMGDGRAVLRSTIREYLCSEAMAALGIETTRALGMMVSDTPVYREQVEQGACLIRLAQTHIRFGHFEHFFYTEQYDELRLLADNVIEWYMPECAAHDKPYLPMFEQVVARTATMIAQWQAVGFAHGVMNTDNMSILGQTFDYGPFGFLDDYEPGYICNHSDYQGRYAFEQQPRVALWNLSALAHALSPLIERDDLELALAQYEPTLGKVFSQLMRQKLGLLSQQEGDSELFNAMFALLAENHTDYTRFFRTLSQLDREDEQTVIDLFIDRDAAHGWLSRYLERVAMEQTASGEAKSAQQRCEQMRAVNPKYILRNYLAQQAIDKAQQGDFSEVHTLAKLLKNPYDEQAEMEAYAHLPPEWCKKMVISCSS